jgi:hypothetical protein
MKPEMNQILEIDFKPISLRGLQKINFGMIGNVFAEKNKDSNIRTSLLILSQYKADVEVDPDLPNYIAIGYKYDYLKHESVLLVLPEAQNDYSYTELARVNGSTFGVQVNGFSKLFTKDKFMTNRFEHSPNFFKRCTKSNLALVDKNYISFYSKADLQMLNNLKALPSWATHVYTSQFKDYDQDSEFDRIYRLGTYRFIGETEKTVEKSLVSFMYEPVPDFESEYPEVSAKIRANVMRSMHFAGTSLKRVWDLNEFLTVDLDINALDNLDVPDPDIEYDTESQADESNDCDGGACKI